MLPFDFNLTANGPATTALKTAGCKTFEDVCLYVAKLPYQRNMDKANALCVINEQCGTCSTKHVLLKTIAEEHDRNDIHLVIGIFLMTRNNTPKITPVLNSFNLRYIPEAHCYLTYEGKIYDFTFHNANLDFIQDLLEEHIVNAADVARDKINLHQQYIRKWSKREEIPYSLEEIWQIRELCIAALSK